MSEIPIIILREGTQRSRGKDAQRSNIMAAKVLAETVRSTIGPRGMDKMMVGSIGDIVITNEGATIMKEMDDQNRADKMHVEVPETHDSGQWVGLPGGAVKDGVEESAINITADIDLMKGMKNHGKSLSDAGLVSGIVIDKEIAHSQMPTSVSNAKIALLNAKLEIEKAEMDAKININRPEEMELFLQEEENLLNAMAQQVADSGANVQYTEKAA